MSAIAFNDISVLISESLGDFHLAAQAPLVEVAVALDPTLAPPDTCPKCIAPRVESAAACPCCGLVYARFHLSQVVPQRALLDSFVYLTAETTLLAEHSRLLARAELLGELPRVLRLYRILRARAPSNPLPPQVLAEAVKVASAALAAQPAAAPTRPLVRNLVLVLMLTVFLATVTINTVAALR